MEHVDPIPPQIQELIRGDGLFVLLDSGGKDSQAMRILLRDLVPRERLVVVFSGMGTSYPGAADHARRGAERDGLSFVCPTGASAGTDNKARLKRILTEVALLLTGPAQPIVFCLPVHVGDRELLPRLARVDRRSCLWLPIHRMSCAEAFDVVLAAGETPLATYDCGTGFRCPVCGVSVR